MGRRAKPAKTNVEAKRSLARKSPRDEGARARDLEKRLAEALKREAEAQQRETATADILRVISNSLTDVQPVLDAVAESAARLCESSDAEIFRRDGARLLLVAHHGPIPSRTLVVPLARETFNGRTVLDGRTLHVVDLQSETDEFPRGSEIAAQHGTRAQLSVPLMREGVAIGTISLRRAEARRFTERQVALLQTFADQAVIAIENVRLFKELEDKNKALTEAHAQVSEALDQQTATSEILRAMSGSLADVQPVFDTIVRSGLRLLGGYSATMMLLRDGDCLDLVAYTSTSAEADASLVDAFPLPLRSLPPGERAVRDRRPHAVEDVESDPDVTNVMRETGRARGWHSNLFIPMIREDVALGLISITRRDPGPFAAGEIALLETFAAQAVIAIENVRLFKELEVRTQDLTRSVGELTALGEVGRALSSTLDLHSVLRTIVARATELSDTDAGVIYEYDEAREVFLPRATERLEAEILETMLATPVRKGEGATGRLAEGQEPIEVPDILAAPAESRVRSALVGAGYRALLAVPLLREDHLLGGLTVIRKATGQFAPEVIELLRTFATQSALAIQNARLFLEIEDKGRQVETASRHKSEFLANMSHELRTPLNAIIGYSELLEEDAADLDGGRLVPDLQKIATAAKHQLSLINDILDLSKVEAGRMELELADFDLLTAIDGALALVRERATRRGIALGSRIDGGVGSIQADERKVKQVLLNLLSNALKFTPEGGRIEVHATLTEGKIEVSVSDTGVGIAAEDQGAIFEEFRQVGTADKKVEGTGLGLALSRKFIELHGGRIWVKSELGHGSTFTFTLPVRREPSDRGGAAPTLTS